jgi:hypothetical protein
MAILQKFCSQNLYIFFASSDIGPAQQSLRYSVPPLILSRVAKTGRCSTSIQTLQPNATWYTFRLVQLHIIHVIHLIKHNQSIRYASHLHIQLRNARSRNLASYRCHSTMNQQTHSTINQQLINTSFN